MIKIMLDSSSDCKNKELYDYFIPMTINIDEKEYYDGINLNAETFYPLLTNAKDFPRTSQPSPNDFLTYFEKVKENGDELLYFCISSTLSGTYQSANIAKEMVEYDKIHIIDTRTVSHMIELLAKYARTLIDNGYSSNEIAEKCEELKTKIKVYAGVDTLEYLQKGGRIGKASALVGTLANLKPLITVSPEGAVDAVGKALGFTRAMQTLVDRVKKHEINPEFPICSLYTYGEQNCIKLEEKLRLSGYKTNERLQVGSTIGAHVGPGVYGVFFVEK